MATEVERCCELGGAKDDHDARRGNSIDARGSDAAKWPIICATEPNRREQQVNNQAEPRKQHRSLAVQTFVDDRAQSGVAGSGITSHLPSKSFV